MSELGSDRDAPGFPSASERTGGGGEGGGGVEEEGGKEQIGE